jgi:hypothetical protein
MWTHEISIETTATPQRIWSLWIDVVNWPSWNAGVERSELHGAFAQGTPFRMWLPDGPCLTSVLVEVEENDHFIDETTVEDTCVRVRHQLVAVHSGCTRIVYRTEITGQMAAQLGSVVTADFAAVLAALKSRAEAMGADGMP